MSANWLQSIRRNFTARRELTVSIVCWVCLQKAQLRQHGTDGSSSDGQSGNGLPLESVNWGCQSIQLTCDLPYKPLDSVYCRRKWRIIYRGGQSIFRGVCTR